MSQLIELTQAVKDEHDWGARVKEEAKTKKVVLCCGVS